MCVITAYGVRCLGCWLLEVRCRAVGYASGMLPQFLVGRVVQSLQCLTAGWTVRRSNPGGAMFSARPDRPWGPSSLLYNGYRLFPGGKERPGRDAEPSLPSSAVVMKGQSYTSTPPRGRTACTEPQCLHKGALYLTSVPVQGCTLPLPLPSFHNDTLYSLVGTFCLTELSVRPICI